ncbi:MAG TPA: ABC transporter substrate-binding protein [Burkholderiaceae bacterium]|nr:ABC transporter substrate-binding protein [Burkholderiaceae bacterium]
MKAPSGEMTGARAGPAPGAIRRRLTILAGTLVLLAAPPALAQEAIRIGAILTTSGPAAGLGEPQLKTLKLLVDEANAKGGVLGRKIELVTYDDGADPQKATVFARRLIEADGVHVILGPTASGPSLAIVPIVQQAGITNISFAGAAAIIDPVKSWVFKMPASDAMAARAIYLDMRREGRKKLAILHDTGGFGRASLDQFRKLAPLFDVGVGGVESYDPKDTDTSGQLTKLKGANADALLVLGIPPGPALVTKNFRDLGMTLPIYHTHALATPEFLKLAGPAAEGARIPAPPLVLAPSARGEFRAVVERYVEAYQKRYDAVPTVFAGYAHDGMMLTLAAIRAAGSTERNKVRDALEKISNAKGVNGTYNFSPGDHLGLGADALPLAVVRKGQFEPVR